MDKKELYDVLASLEQTSHNNPNFWQAVAYLSYCNDQILKHEDQDFNTRLLALIDRNDDDNACCSREKDIFPYDKEEFIPYAISPEGSKNRCLETEFFPAALRSTFQI